MLSPMKRNAWGLVSTTASQMGCGWFSLAHDPNATRDTTGSAARADVARHTSPTATHAANRCFATPFLLPLFDALFDPGRLLRTVSEQRLPFEPLELDGGGVE